MRTARFGNFRFGETRFSHERVIHRIRIEGLYNHEQGPADAEYDDRHGEAAAVSDLQHDRVDARRGARGK